MEDWDDMQDFIYGVFQEIIESEALEDKSKAMMRVLLCADAYDNKEV